MSRCNAHSAAIIRRHNEIVERLINAARKPPEHRLLINQPITGISTLRLDIILIDDRNKTCAIVDVVVSYENRSLALWKARADKETKYAPIKEAFERKGYNTSVEAYVVGALGTMDPLNGGALKSLGDNHEYNKLMEKLIVSDVIRWARDIYVEHVTGRRQYPDKNPQGIRSGNTEAN
ncbi:unnamed protein product [Auanema sp. JU1783]|nr:unnamed protein product [Auanema sp. JU1783]